MRALAVLLLAVLALATAPQVRSAWSLEAELLRLTNASRLEAGLPALRGSAYLSTIARWRSADMARRGYFSHEIPGSATVFARIRIPYRLAGENIGWTTAPASQAARWVHAAFMASPAHRRNVLTRRFDRIGLGHVVDGDRHLFTVLFLDTE